MAYENSEFFLGVPPQYFDGVPFQPAGFDGTFTLLDGELAYITPAGKQGTVNVSIQYREDDGTALVDEDGVTLPSFTDTINVAGGSSGNITWESFSVAQSEIAAGGASVDFSGRFFATDSEDAISVPDGKTIVGGTYVAGAEVTNWTNEGNGIYSGDFTPDDPSDLTGYEYLVDMDAVFNTATPTGGTDPILARSNRGPTDDTFENPRAYNSGWFEDDVVADVLLSTGGVSDSNSYPWGSTPENPVTGVITGFTLSGQTKTDVESIFASTQVTEFVIMFKAGANRIAFARVGTYNASTGKLVFAVAPGITYTGYSPFSVTGSSTIINQDREYTIDTQNNKVYYRPAYGTAPTNVRLITGSANGGGVFTVPSDATGVNTFNGVTILGASSMVDNRYGIQCTALGTQHRMNITNSTIGYGSFLVRGGGWSAQATDGSATGSSYTNNSFFRYNQLGIVTSEGATVTGNICMHSEARSFVITGNLSSTDAHGSPGSLDYVPNKTTFKDNYLYMPCCNHGQAISLYSGSYLNAEVSHNLIRKMRANVSWQPGDSSELAPNPSSGTSELLIDNNLFVYDEAVDDVTDSSQATVAFNGNDDSYLTNPENHTCKITRNTLSVPSSLYVGSASSLVWIDMRLNVGPYKNCDVEVSNNVGFCQSNPDTGVTTHTHGGNAFVATAEGGSSTGAFSSADLGYFDTDFAYEEICTDTEYTSTEWQALGGGDSGIRWTQQPLWSQLDGLGLNWSTLYPSEGSATYTGATQATYEVDNRAVTPSTYTWEMDGFIRSNIASFGVAYLGGVTGFNNNFPVQAGATDRYDAYAQGESVVDNDNDEIVIWFDPTSAGNGDYNTWVANNPNATFTFIVNGSTTYTATMDDVSSEADEAYASVAFPGSDFSTLTAGTTNETSDSALFAITEND